MVEVATRLRDILNETVSKSDESIDIENFMMRYSSDVIGTCAFGIECNSLKDPNAEFISMGRLAVEKQRHSPRFLALITSYKNIARILRIKVTRDDVSAFFMKAIRETVNYRENNKISRNDFMDILFKSKNQKYIRNGDSLTFNEIAAQINVFFIGGFETSSIALSHCLYELAQNPGVQNKARHMIQEVYERYDGQLTYEMFMELSYIQQIVQGKSVFQTFFVRIQFQ